MTQYVKDKKISIFKSEYVMDNIGVETEKIVLYAENIWAYYRQLSAKEYYAAGQTNYKEDVLFRINWRDDIDNTMTIMFRGQHYDIARIDDFEGYKKDIVIYAVEKRD